MISDFRAGRAIALFSLALAACDNARGTESQPLPEEASALIASVQDENANGVIMTFKTPTCGCCGAWVDRMREAGFEVQVADVDDLGAIKTKYGVPRGAASCHTSVVNGYLVEGHVPADAIERMLRERPDIHGIAVPGMPLGSPGMGAGIAQPYDILAIDRVGRATVYESRQ
jgi:hypothetical protein